MTGERRDDLGAAGRSVAVTHAEAETSALGEALAADLEPGTVVFLEGPLGAGKTAFVRGLAAGLGAAPEDVSSPTFAIVQEYRGRIALQHVDLYRLTPVEVEDLALDDLLEEAAMAVEWPDRWTRAPEPVIRVVIEPVDPSTRRVIIIRPDGYSTR